MLDKLNHYLQLWTLSNPQLLATTPRGHIYTVLSGETTVVLKMLTPDGGEEVSGALALRYFDGHGAVRLLRYDDGAQLLEYVDGGDLVPFVQRGDDEQATHIIADVLSKLHRVPPASIPDGLTPLAKWFDALFEKAVQERVRGADSLYIRGADMAERLLATQPEAYVLHGDIHHENVRFSAERGWLAIDPKGLWGERAYDAANTLYNPPEMPPLVVNQSRLLRNAAILADRMAIDHSRMMAYAFVYGCLSASWWLQDGDHDDVADETLSIAALAEPYARV